MHLSKHSILVLVPVLILISCSSDQKKKRIQTSASQAARTQTLEISNGWVRPAPGGANSAAYLAINNGSTTNDTLTGITADWVDTAELHESYTDKNGMSGMRPAANQPIPAGGKLQLKPGKFHIMLMRIKHTLAAGDSVRLTLHFSINGSRSIKIPVQRTAQPSPKK